MSLYRIILEPITTEKTSTMDVKDNVVTVKVSPFATKIDIKNAFKTIYDVDVAEVRIINTREKFKYGRKWPQIKRRTFKKAYVKIAWGKKVDFSIVK